MCICGCLSCVCMYVCAFVYVGALVHGYSNKQITIIIMFVCRFACVCGCLSCVCMYVCVCLFMWVPWSMGTVTNKLL